MGRTYAGILGLVTFLVVLARGLVHGSEVAATLRVACVCLFAFAAIGWVAAQVAVRVVDESVRAKIDAEVEAGRATQEKADATDAV